MFTIDPNPISDRPFFGLGAQADGYLYDSCNAQFRLTPQDYELNERRLDELRLANTRMFVHVDWFNPSLDGKTFDWDDDDFGCFLKQLKRHRANGTQANLVLFQPPRPTAGKIPAIVKAMVAMLKHLVADEGFDNIRWLTLWNEPESAFPHDSPLVRRLFGEDALSRRLSWADFVAAHRLALNELAAAGLSDQIRILTPDCVWGAPLRLERLQLAVDEFGADDVGYCYHNYSSEDPSFYDGNPDWAYPGIAAEAAAFRRLVGPDKPLLLTEFNIAGDAFSSRFPGCGKGGVSLIDTIDGAVAVADKILQAIAAGVDGFTIWCLQDMMFCGQIGLGQMNFGLWRFKGAAWSPRPLYHYYAALVGALRPGAVIHRVTSRATGFPALWALRDDGETMVILNPTAASHRISVQLPSGSVTRRRVYEEVLPANAERAVAQSEKARADDTLEITLAPQELTILQR